ncbi:hypothetical protein ACH5RR_036525 [Cinchona calisaya]|uniref:Transposase n=1 Tax=Cinchona calisaya TaxID=153742 RepID=A0ABD2Y5T6_9GENT
MVELAGIDQDVAKWFHDKPPAEWSRAFFSTVPKCDTLLDNLCENFNSKILAAKELGIVSMVKWQRLYLLNTYLACYSPTIHPISVQIPWVDTKKLAPLPPNYGRPAGRPKKRRRKSADEIQ